MELTKLSVRDKVSAIETELLKQPQLELPVRHFFSPGVYARELFIPAGTLLTGKIHKCAQINILSKGVIRVLIGEHVEEIEASYTVVSPPGTKRIAYAVTDCIWTTILPTDETDPEVIERRFTVGTEDEYQEHLMKEQTKCLS